jgi:hypothetical protein
MQPNLFNLTPRSKTALGALKAIAKAIALLLTHQLTFNLELYFAVRNINHKNL